MDLLFVVLIIIVRLVRVSFVVTCCLVFIFVEGIFWITQNSLVRCLAKSLKLYLSPTRTGKSDKHLSQAKRIRYGRNAHSHEIPSTENFPSCIRASRIFYDGKLSLNVSFVYFICYSMIRYAHKVIKYLKTAPYNV